MHIVREYWPWLVAVVVGVLVWVFVDDPASAAALFVIFGVVIPTTLRSRRQ